jgi:carboxypeptidase PM20D1
MLRDTVAVTILEAGCKSNVLPNSARAVLSIRLLPGSDPDVYTSEIESLVANPAVSIKRLKCKTPTDSRLDTPGYAALQSVAGEDGSDVVPILSPGASDCRFWRRAGVTCYGWVPFMIDASDLHSVHGANERVSVEQFGLGIQSLYRAVLRLSAI